MVIVNFKDGRTEHFDLRDPTQSENLQAILQTTTVSALSLHHNKVQNSLNLHKRFRPDPVFGAELLMNGSDKPVGEKIFAQAGDVRVSVTLLYESTLMRCDLIHTGRMKYNPNQRRRR